MPGPNDDRGDAAVPDRADNRAHEPGAAPRHVEPEQVPGDLDVDEGPHGADGIEEEQAVREVPAFEPPRPALGVVSLTYRKIDEPSRSRGRCRDSRSFFGLPRAMLGRAWPRDGAGNAASD